MDRASGRGRTEGCTRVTETWQDDRAGGSDACAARVDRLVTRGSTLEGLPAGTTRRTLDRLKTDLER